MVMKLTSVRKGFATNSSSVHSIILGGGDVRSHAEIAESYDPNYGQSEFGWEQDTASGTNSMINYYLAAFGGIPLETEVSVEFQTILDKFLEAKTNDKWGFYVDHGTEHVSDAGFGFSEDDFWNFVNNVSCVETDNDNH